MAGKLYLVATPIGNLEDITLRAIETLKNVDIIAAEDTRHTLKLLNHLKIKKTLISYYKQTEKEKSEILVNELLENKDIALVSDAGTPGISDPGEAIIKTAILNNIEIIPIPGACAGISALISSGMNTEEFIFLGFLPKRTSDKTKKIEEIKYFKQTIIVYEAPHRLKNTLKTLAENLGERNVTIAHEMTKIHEEFIRCKLCDSVNQIGEPRGEYVLIIEGAKNNELDNVINNLKKQTLEEHYSYYEKLGFGKKEIIKKIAKDRDLTKNEIYQKFIKK